MRSIVARWKRLLMKDKTARMPSRIAMDEAMAHFFAEEAAMERVSSRGRKDVGVLSQDEDDGKGVLSRKRHWKEQGPARRVTVVGMVAAQPEGKALRRR